MGLIAIIGGTGVCDIKMLKNAKEHHMDTFYGTIHYVRGTYEGKELIFLPRHGKTHSIPPHLINYRGNMLGLKRLGVTAVISTTAVGSLNRDFKPNEFVLPDQFLDFTKSRHTSFFDGGENGVVHVDMTEPYCPTLRRTIMAAADELGGYALHNGGTYVCTEGPRFETPAEIKMYEKLGGDLVGMTNVPEVCLAREAEICYATVSMVTNFAAGISPALTLTDGTYEAKADEADDNGFTEQVTMTVANGKITEMNWDSISEDGTKKSDLAKNGEYVMTEDGLNWAEQSQALTDAVIDHQSLDFLTMDEQTKTDAVAGVSISVGSFADLAQQCIRQAGGETAVANTEESADGQADASAENTQNPGTQIDAVSGATISSTAVVTGINEAYEFLQSAK